MTTALCIALTGLWLGGALCLERLRWFRAPSRRARLEPYLIDARGAAARRDRPRAATAGAVDTVVDRAAVRLGGHRALRERLVQAGLEPAVATHRARRAATTTVAVLLTTGAVLAGRPGWGPGSALVLCAVLGPVAGEEVWLRTRRRARADRLAGELPIVAEQLGMLLSAGFSLPAAVQRLAARANGVAAAGLTEVVRRVRQGESEMVALEEWAARSGTDGAVRLVRVLALHRQAGDLGQLISDEARSVRAEQHRRLLESISRRGQLVWIPVTFATLVPGLIVLAVPFASAVRQITGP